MATEEREARLRMKRGTIRSALGRLAHAADTLPRLWVIVSLGAIFILLARGQVRPNDFWWHARAGQWIVEHGRVPRSDLFSFTRFGEPWAYQSWLMEVALYWLLQVGGLPLVIFAHAVVMTSAYALLLGTSARASGGSLRIASVTTIAAAAATIATWNVRPQAISFPLFGLALLLIDRDARRAEEERETWWRAGGLWWLPPVFVLWANAHGGFLFGLALLGTYAAARLTKWVRGRSAFPVAVVVITALSGGATLLTPLGLGMVDYVLGFVRHPITGRLNLEFMPPTVRMLPGQLFFGFVIVWIVVLIVSRYRPSIRESLGLLAFGVLALWGIRNVIWFGFVAAPSLAASLRQGADRFGLTGQARTGRPWTNRAFTVFVAVAGLASLPWLRPHIPLPGGPVDYASSDTPVEAVDFLCKQAEPGHVFHTEAYGSYLIWACPQVRVFADTRIELYPEEQWLDYLALNYARYDWRAILERYGVDTLLLRREAQEQLIEAASAAPEWERVYEDEQAVILQRIGGP